MKELSIEQKAQRYDEAIKKAGERYNKEYTSTLERSTLAYVFSELTESEDERIREEIITYLYNELNNITQLTPRTNEFERWIDWLEKQDEHSNFLSKIQVGDKVTRNKEGVLVNLSQLNRVAKKQGEKKPDNVMWHKVQPKEYVLEKTLIIKKNGEFDMVSDTILSVTDAEYALPVSQLPNPKSNVIQGEQKSADKVEPKFKVGDWVVFNNKHQSIYQVEKIEDGYYILRHTHGGTFRVCVLHDKSLRLWTIQDAKDGDVLACNEEILLFKSYSVQGRISLYCWYNGQTNNFHDKEVVDALLTTRNKICPATKEQRDILFQKIKEAGYEWDAEKKELRTLKTT